jgi:hypothetical protein
VDLRKAFSQLTALLILAGLVAGPWAPGLTLAAPDAPDEPTDGFGYTYIRDLNEPWIEANGGTLLSFPSLDDSFVGPLNIGFDFRFYEGTYSSLYVSTNGLVTFGSGALAYQSKPIPWAPTPNNFIAALWADLKMHTGRAYILTMGASPSRSCIIEWEIYDRNPSDPAAVLVLNFEVILYENTANILLQYKALAGVPLKYTMGIEDSDGINGLQYLLPLVEGSDIRFIRPDPGPRVKVLPRIQGSFAYDQQALYRVSVENNGEFGPDTYNLKVASSAPGWQAQFYDRLGATPLGDTNGDAVIDTGALAQGTAITITLRLAAPAVALPGDFTTLVFTATSSLAATRLMTGTVQSAIPVQFSQVYVDGRIRMGQFWKENVIDRTVLGNYTGATLSMEGISTDNYLVAWESQESVVSPTLEFFTNIRYQIFSRLGGAGEELLLTNGEQVVGEPEVIQADARNPTIAPVPDGRVAVAWSLLKRRPLPTGETEKNSNIYFAVLDSAGNMLSERFDVTQDTGWFLTGHTYDYPGVVVTGDSRYVVCWIDQISAARAVRCASHTFGASGISQTAITPVYAGDPTAGSLNHLTMAALTNNRVLVTFTEAYPDTSKVFYAVVDNGGALVAGPVQIAGANGVQPRAVQFANSNILLGWIETDGRVAYTYLDAGYTTGATQYFTHASRRAAGSLSLTLERDGKAVLTWVDLDDQDYLFYALLDQSQAIRTPPMIFISNPWGDPSYQTSDYGFGNAGYLGVYQTSYPYIGR